MVSARYPIETWSRPQLEDHFHNVVEELQNAQKKVKEQEKQIQTFNSRFRRNLLERKSRDEKVVERSKYDDVVKENQILDMKLKAAKHQLLIYTAPSARAATASLMTGRSTFRQPPSTWRQRAPPTAGTGSIDRPPSAPILRKKSEGEKLQLATDEKLTIVRLNRTLKSRNDEIAELKYTIEKLRQTARSPRSEGSVPPSRGSSSSSKRSSHNNNDNDEQESELSEMSELSDSARSVTPVAEEKKARRGSNGTKQVPPPVTAQRAPEQSERVLMDKLRVAESDLQILREECELVKKANERLVQQSLSKSTEYGARESIEEKKRIVNLEEQLKETEKRIRESEHRRREDQKKFEAMRLHYKTKYEAAKAEKKNSPVAVKVEEERSDSPPPMVYEPVRKRGSQSELNRTRRGDDDLLQKLYKEVADILQSHDVGITELERLGAGEHSLSKWQQMISETDERLEQCRNMLVVQHDINQKQADEIRLLKDELDRLKTLSAEMVARAKEEAEEKQKKIYLLEEQIRTIAYSGQKPVKLLTTQISIPAPSVNTYLSVRLIHVSPAPSLTSKFFFSLEFFDFQLETTPILDAKQQNLDFTTVYDVLVSNLLIHYLQTNGITIEMYRPAHDCYKLLAAATISLIPLFEESVVQKFGSEIILKSVETGIEMCTLRYEIEVSQPIADSFKKFKRSETARTMMPLQLEAAENEEKNFEPLTILVNRVVGIEHLGRDHSVEFCVVYEFLSFSPFFTDFSTSPEIRSKRDFFIPKTDSARNLFSTSNISFFLIENIPKQDGVIATLHLPLLPLCKLGGSMKGTFPMLDVDGRPTSISLDICLIWKHEIPSFFLKPEPLPVSEKKKEESKNDTPILPQPVRRTSKQFDVTPVKEEELVPSEPVPPAKLQPLRTNQSLPPLQTVLPPALPRFSSSSSETSFSSSSKDAFSPPETTTGPSVFDYQIPRGSSENEQSRRLEFDDDDDEVESVSAKSSHRESEPTPSAPHHDSESSDSDSDEEIPERRLRLETEELPVEVPEDVEQGEVTPRPLESEGTKEELLESRESTPVTQRSLEEPEEVSEEGTKRELKRDELSSLLGVLPPIAKPRNIPVGSISSLTEQKQPPNPVPPGSRRIVFTDPLHYSVPPSESSSTSSPRRAEKPPVPLPEYEGHSLIRVPKPQTPPDNDVLEKDMRVLIQLETFELVPGSTLQIWTRDNTQFIVDWCFLDFPNEESRSTVFNFPKTPTETVDILYKKEYVLTRGQLDLLKQWIQASVKLELTIVKTSPGEEEELGFGNILIYPNNTQNKSFVVEIFDKSGVNQAELQLTIQFSRPLLERLNY